MIEVQNLTKRYGTHMAVNNISFQVEEGEILGFLGPNGAGKSTTMNILTGYLSASEGTVKINGYDLSLIHIWAVYSRASSSSWSLAISSCIFCA